MVAAEASLALQAALLAEDAARVPHPLQPTGPQTLAVVAVVAVANTPTRVPAVQAW